MTKPAVSEALSTEKVMVWLGCLVLVLAPPGILFFLQDRQSWPIALSLMVVMVCVILAFWKQNKPLSILLTLAIAIAGRLFLLPLEPSLSDDLYRYAWDGQLFAAGINPYLSLPSDVLNATRQDPVLFEKLNSQHYYSVYPPVVQYLFSQPFRLASGEPLQAMFWIKAQVGLIELAGLFLLSRMTDWRSLILYAWNPVIMVETWGQGHTEGVAAGLLVFAFWAFRKQLLAASLTGVTLAGWVKLYPLLLLPFLLRRTGWWYICVPVGLTIVLWLPFAWPPHEFPQVMRNISTSLRLYTNLFEYNAGIYYSVRWFLDDFLRPNISGLYLGHFAGRAMQIAFLSYSCWLFWSDRHRQWPLEWIAIWLFGGLLLFSTTIHPWYFVPVIAMIALSGRTPWSLLWLTAASPVTYLGYSHDLYFAAVVFVWAGWIVLVLLQDAPVLLQHVLKFRARQKANTIIKGLNGAGVSLGAQTTVLDVGAAEGYVGEAIASLHNSDVDLLDVVDMNRTRLPLKLYDGCKFPFEEASREVVILSYVLHHCREPDLVLSEAMRVSRGVVVVLESVDRSTVSAFLLRKLDIAANRIRSGFRMNEQEDSLNFRSSGQWIEAVNRLGGNMVWSKESGNFLHPQFAFVLKAD